MKNPYSPSRSGKIARLPQDFRDQLNRRLQNGEQSDTILPWLNNLPEVKTLLAAEFDSHPINRQNLSEWRKGGFRDWLIRLKPFTLCKTSKPTQLSPISRSAVSSPSQRPSVQRISKDFKGFQRYF